MFREDVLISLSVPIVAFGLYRTKALDIGNDVPPFLKLIVCFRTCRAGQGGDFGVQDL